jgi:hypothetical protein
MKENGFIKIKPPIFLNLFKKNFNQTNKNFIHLLKIKIFCIISPLFLFTIELQIKNKFYCIQSPIIIH